MWRRCVKLQATKKVLLTKPKIQIFLQILVHSSGIGWSWVLFAASSLKVLNGLYVGIAAHYAVIRAHVCGHVRFRSVSNCVYVHEQVTTAKHLLQPNGIQIQRSYVCQRKSNTRRTLSSNILQTCSGLIGRHLATDYLLRLESPNCK